MSSHIAQASLRRPDVLAVHSVHEFVYTVPDLDVAERFYDSFGLDVRRHPWGLALYTHGCAHRWARVLPGADKRLQWISLGIDAADRSRFLKHFESLGIGLIDPPGDTHPDSLWIAGPDGVPLELAPAEKSAPSSKTERIIPPAFAPQGRAPSRSQIQKVRPLHLSHILLFSADVDAAARFYMDVLGLRMSDRSSDIIAFLHGAHGSDHHLIALAKSHGAGLHHSSWDVASLDDVGLGKQQMAQAGHEQGWGLGRHVLGSNYFHYVRDPWGSYVEYSYDIDFIAHDQDWPAGDHPAQDSLYVWGPAVPADFVTNFETPNAGISPRDTGRGA